VGPVAPGFTGQFADCSVALRPPASSTKELPALAGLGVNEGAELDAGLPLEEAHPALFVLALFLKAAKEIVSILN